MATAVAGIGVASIAAATSFQQQMAKIQALTDTSAAQAQWYQQQILQLAPQLDVAPEKLAEGLYFVVSAGQSGAQAIDTLRYSAMAAAAGMTSFSGVADGVTSVMNAYRSTNLDAATATGVLTKLVSDGKTTWQALTSSLGIVATTSAAAGIKVQEMSAAMAALSQVGGAAATRRLGMDLMNLERNIGIDVDSIAKKAKSMGYAFNEGAFAAAPLIEKLQMLQQMTGGLGDLTTKEMAQFNALSPTLQQGAQGQDLLAAATAHANSQFKTLVGGAAAFIPAAILLTNKLSDGTLSYTHILNDMTKATKEHGQATVDAFNVMRSSVGQQMNMFHVTLESIAVLIGLNLLPAVSKMLMAFIGLGRGIIYLLQLPGAFDRIRDAVIALGIVLAITVGPAFVSFLVGVATAAGPILLGVAAVMALAAGFSALVQHMGGWPAIWAKITPLLEKGRDLLMQLWQHLQPLLTFAWDQIKAAGETIRAAFADPQVQAALQQLKQVLPYIAMALGVLIALPIVAIIAAIVAAIVALSVVIRVASAVIGLLVHVIAGVILVLSKIPDLLGASGDAIGDFLGSIGDFIGTVFGAIGAVLGFIGSLPAKFAAMANWLVQHNYYVYAAFMMVQHAIHAVGDALGAIGDAIGNVFGAIGGFFGNVFGAIGGFFGTVFGAIGGWLGQLLGQIGRGLGNWLGRLGQAFGQVSATVTNAVGDLLNQAVQWGENLIGNLIQGLTNKLGDLKRTLGNIAGAIANVLGFHSPAKEGPGSTADQWMPNLIRMLAQGLTTGTPVLGRAATLAASAISTGITGGANGSTGLALAGRGGVAGGAIVAGAGTNVGTLNQTWNLSFPNAINADQIRTAVQQIQQDQYRQNRRVGASVGIRAGIQ